MAHPLSADHSAQKETAAQAGNRDGGEFFEKEASNLHSADYIAGLLDAIAEAIDPTDCPVEAIAGLVELADAILPDGDLEPDDEDVEDDREPFDMGGGR